MTKKILVVSASPRKGGNSDLLCDEFIKGAESSGHRVEKVFVNDMDINYCRGCGACENTHKCAQKDDMADILDKIVSSNVVVLASPVYFYTVSGQMKTFIDRCIPKYKEITEKEFYFIVTAATKDVSAAERAVECFRGFTDCLENCVEKGIVYGVGAWQKGDVKKTKAMGVAFNMGKNV